MSPSVPSPVPAGTGNPDGDLLRAAEADPRLLLIAPIVHTIWCEDELCKPDHGDVWLIPDIADARRIPEHLAISRAAPSLTGEQPGGEAR